MLQLLQNNTPFLLQDNKMYAVIVIAMIILLGISAFLIHLERRIKKLEKEENL
jgi:hypothetical protein